MNTKHEPCSICEKYMDGVACDENGCPVAVMKTEIERLQKAIAVVDIMEEQHKYALKKAKTEAIKEFAKRLKKRKQQYTLDNQIIFVDVIDVEDIDNLVKEMTEREANAI